MASTSPVTIVRTRSSAGSGPCRSSRHNPASAARETIGISLSNHVGISFAQIVPSDQQGLERRDDGRGRDGCGGGHPKEGCSHEPLLANGEETAAKRAPETP